MMGGIRGRFNRKIGATGAQWRGFSRKSEGILSFQATENRYTVGNAVAALVAALEGVAEA